MHRGGNPIYALLPDILSALSREPGLAADGFAAIMQLLLGFIKQDKHSDGLKEKLVLRFEGTADPVEWANLAFCLSQLTYSEKVRCMWRVVVSQRGKPPSLFPDVARHPSACNLATIPSAYPCQRKRFFRRSD